MLRNFSYTSSFKKYISFVNKNFIKNLSKKLFDWAMRYSFNGMFPEQIHKELGVPISAMPLGWSNAMFLIYVYENDDVIIPKISHQ